MDKKIVSEETIDRYLSNELSPEAVEELEIRMMEDVDLFERVRKRRLLTTELQRYYEERPPTTSPEDIAKSRPMTAIESSPGRRWRSPWRYSLIAAGIVFLVVSIPLVFQLFNSNSQSAYTQTGEKSTITLPDSSIVYLNYKTQIKYPRDFTAQRELQLLSGQIIVDVKKAAIPFVVETENARITVLGTRFDVNVRHQQTRVIVDHGSVRLQSLKKNRDVVLSAGEAVSCDLSGDLSAVEQVAEPQSLDWTIGTLVFRDQSLSGIFAELEGTFGVEIEFQGDASFKKNRFTAIFRKAKLEDVLQAIAFQFDLRYVIDKNHISIYR